MSEQTTYNNAYREIDLLSSQVNTLREENAALRAAVAEMARMLPVLEEIEERNPIQFRIIDNGLATLNAYRHALETALAKMKVK